VPQAVFISGIGSISSIGNNSSELLGSILSKTHGISKIKYLDSKHKNVLLAGEVKMSNEELAQKVNIDGASDYSRTTLLGLLAARETVQTAGIDIKNDGYRTGLISSTSVGGIDKSEDFYKLFLEDENSGKLRNILSHDCGDSTEKIAVDLGIHHFVSTISTACSSSANAAIIGARLILNNVLDRVIVGGTDALTKYTLNGFKALKILDSEHCKPFDKNRKGLNLGEAAAYFLLESEASLNARNGVALGQLVGFGNANDAFHQTASSPEGDGAFKAMSIALKKSGIDPNEIDYINAHGTATPINDLSEGNAIKKIFNDTIPSFSSTKSYTGHTLAASGAIEGVIAMLALRDNFLPPNLNFSEAIPEINMTPLQEIIKPDRLKYILSNSLGFGGNCSSLIFSAV